jgi:DNA-binding transcriptional LysR family regulator
VKHQELILLHLFDAIMTEGSVTRAADRLAMTQPAVSNAVARMRERWKDPLFVKKGRQIEPTAFALSLWEQIREPIRELSSALDASAFDPVTSRRKFRIALGDSLVDLCWLPLVKQLDSAAPLVDLYSLPYSLDGAITQLREAHVDLAIGPLDYHDRSLRSIYLFESRYVLAMRIDHPLAGRPITVEDFLASKQLLVSTTGDATGYADRALQQQGLSRRVGVTVNHFSAVPKMLAQGDLIAVVPQIVAANSEFRSSLWLTDPPLEVPPTPIYLIWHARAERDPGLVWMRKVIENIVITQLAVTVGDDPAQSSAAA